MRRTAVVMALVSLLGACRETPAGPAESRVLLLPHGDSILYATPGAVRSEDVRVAAVDAGTRVPVSGIQVQWQLLFSGGALGASASATDEHGVAATWLLQAPLGSYRVRATTPRLTGPAPTVEVRIVEPPIITAIQPAGITAGAQVVITGTNFSSDATQNAVTFDGVRGRVLSATPTQLTVEVPLCLPSRQVSVVAALGAVASAPLIASAAGTAGTLLDLAPGQVRTLATAAELACVRLPGDQPGAAWVMVVHNVASVPVPPLPFELRALTPAPPIAAEPVAAPEQAGSFSHDWELMLRQREREIVRSIGAAREQLLSAAAGTDAAGAVPAQGSRREFNVFDRDGKFRKVTAVARIISIRAIMYVDVEAEAELTNADLEYFADIFDAPVYPSLVGVFGEPSDIDGNGRIIVLFTPVVNELTARRQPSFVSGFFYGCDLVSRTRCSGTNEAEIFYSMVPDPSARWGDSRSHALVRAAVPPVLAHEFQHMIHFARRGLTSDALWLSEGLAHTAEEIVADVFAAAGQTAMANSFRSGNLDRARAFLTSPSSTTVVTEQPPGSIEMRGAAWLLLKYLRGHYGGNALLLRLTNSTRVGAANLSQETGRPWDGLSAEFGMALWASGAPSLEGPLDSRYTFVGFDLRATLAPVPGTYQLRPTTLSWQSFATAGSVGAGSGAYFSLLAPATTSPPPLNVVLSGLRGAPFATGSGARLSVLRVR
jgi:hypothetical protein